MTVTEDLLSSMSTTGDVLAREVWFGLYWVVHGSKMSLVAMPTDIACCSAEDMDKAGATAPSHSVI